MLVALANDRLPNQFIKHSVLWTGVLYRKNDKVFIITAWHVLQLNARTLRLEAL
jgi:hypothetical protein